MEWSVKALVLGTGAFATVPSVLLSIESQNARIFHDGRGYDETLSDWRVQQSLLFNAGENTQRVCMETRVKLRDVSHVMCTRFAPDVISGIPGLLFALSGVGAQRLDVAGPVGTHTFVSASRAFVRRQWPVVGARDFFSLSRGGDTQAVGSDASIAVPRCVLVRTGHALVAAIAIVDDDARRGFSAADEAGGKATCPFSAPAAPPASEAAAPGAAGIFGNACRGGKRSRGVNFMPAMAPAAKRIHGATRMAAMPANGPGQMPPLPPPPPLQQASAPIVCYAVFAASTMTSASASASADSGGSFEEEDFLDQDGVIVVVVECPTRKWVEQVVSNRYLRWFTAHRFSRRSQSNDDDVGREGKEREKEKETAGSLDRDGTAPRKSEAASEDEGRGEMTKVENDESDDEDSDKSKSSSSESSSDSSSEDEEVSNGPTLLVVHLAPPEVMSDTRYAQWVESLTRSGATHVVVNAQAQGNRPLFAASLRRHLTLNALAPRAFPLPKDMNLRPSSPLPAAGARAGGGGGGGGGAKAGRQPWALRVFPRCTHAGSQPRVLGLGARVASPDLKDGKDGRVLSIASAFVSSTSPLRRQKQKNGAGVSLTPRTVVTPAWFHNCAGLAMAGRRDGGDKERRLAASSTSSCSSTSRLAEVQAHRRAVLGLVAATLSTDTDDSKDGGAELPCVAPAAATSAAGAGQAAMALPSVQEEEEELEGSDQYCGRSTSGPGRSLDSNLLAAAHWRLEQDAGQHPSASSPTAKKQEQISRALARRRACEVHLQDISGGSWPQAGEVVLLGTGAAAPSKLRNCAATYVHLDAALEQQQHNGAVGPAPDTSSGGLLLDAGEGCLGQLVLRYGTRAGLDLAASLRVVFISHAHLDHHMGLMRIVQVHVADRRRRLTALSRQRQTQRQQRPAARPPQAWMQPPHAHAAGGPFMFPPMPGGEANRVPGPLLVIGPPSVGNFLHSCAAQGLFAAPPAREFASGLHHAGVGVSAGAVSALYPAPLVPFRFVPCGQWNARAQQVVRGHGVGPFAWPATLRMVVVPVEHCPEAYAAVLDFGLTLPAAPRPLALPAGFYGGPAALAPAPARATVVPCRIAYSGDTRPCQRLATAGRGATLLIHEATFQDTPAGRDHARRKRHSTLREAASIAAQMGARWTALTHFSSRFRVPALGTGASSGTAVDEESRKGRRRVQGARSNGSTGVFDWTPQAMHTTCLGFDLMTLQLREIVAQPHALGVPGQPRTEPSYGARGRGHGVPTLALLNPELQRILGDAAMEPQKTRGAFSPLPFVKSRQEEESSSSSSSSSSGESGGDATRRGGGRTRTHTKFA